MMTKKKSLEYTQLEEKLNIWTHGFGFVASCVVLLLFCFRESVSTTATVSLIIFGVSMCILYFASTAYHSATKPIQRSRLNIFDHAAIYVLIAGTYTPFTLVTLEGETGWWIFGVAWGIAFLGIILKLFFTGRFDILSTILYVAMGWLILFAYSPLIENLHPSGVTWLFAGGISYTIGAVLYSISKIPFNHAIFHVFVLGGTFCHFMAVYFYVGV
ncbi:PAQR family membrane homeostasis protein TrhA [Dokdonia sp. Hel_I_53]|uniref:PAQR family membrane homeostasis protein TrhA n=1 Tax=Dokdonia sp. Hel_I_53 TaxID=1566287 RepID=UPI00119C1DBD|nr:hemolysin III family protein [Dokdonia sp. Hel_I_53]TVZ51496.1 hemolysin III [Dokdonia sp. Hel_I_53]